MFRRLMMVITIICGSFGFTIVMPTLASAATGGAENSVTQVSAYDNQSDDSLAVRLSATTPVCNAPDKAGNSTWTSVITLTNLSARTPVGISFEKNTGGRALPGESGSHEVNNSGSEPLKSVVHFQFELKGAPDESIALDIPAPAGGCQNQDVIKETSPVTCYLNNYTDPSVQNEDYSYPVGTGIKLTVHITDPNGIVSNFVVATVEPNSQQFVYGVANAHDSVVELSQAGEWYMQAILTDADGKTIDTTPAGGCEVRLIAKEAATPTPTASASPTPSEVIIDDNGMQPTPAATVTTPVAHQPNKPSAPQAELPMTGARTSFLAILGASLFVLGVLCLILSRKREEPIVDPAWTKLVDALNN